MSGHGHEHGAARQPAITRDSYDELYRSASSVWTGKPNHQLVVEAADSEPGRALDATSVPAGDDAGVTTTRRPCEQRRTTRPSVLYGDKAWFLNGP